jgi:large conductance mechanosensitive channel
MVFNLTFMIREFLAFIKEYNIVGLAMAFVMGAASNDLVKSIVDNMVMPIIEPLMAGVAWEEATISLGPVMIRLGAFVADLLHFLVLAFVVFVIAKKVLKEEKVSKK